MEDGVKKSSEDEHVVKEKIENTRKKYYYYKSLEVIIRLVGVVLSLAAAVVAGVVKESSIISLAQLAPCLPSLELSVTAKWHYLSSTVYLVVANAIACTYGAASDASVTLLLLISDVMMVALLFSANGAAIAVGLIALHGNSHTHWHKVCNLFDRYCQYGAASVVMSMLGSLVFLCLVVLAAFKLHRK